MFVSWICFVFRNKNHWNENGKIKTIISKRRNGAKIKSERRNRNVNEKQWKNCVLFPNDSKMFYAVKKSELWKNPQGNWTKCMKLNLRWESKSSDLKVNMKSENFVKSAVCQSVFETLGLDVLTLSVDTKLIYTHVVTSSTELMHEHFALFREFCSNKRMPKTQTHDVQPKNLKYGYNNIILWLVQLRFIEPYLFIFHIHDTHNTETITSH